MRLSFAKWFVPPTVLAASALHAGCSASPPEEPPAAGAKLSAGSNTASEAARIQDFIESRYTARDVRHSFHTKFGEAIDCVDYDAQPGVKALKARGLPVPPPRSGKPKDATAFGAFADAAFLGQPDSDGKPRECPDGSVPILRITADQIMAAGGLDEFNRVQSTKYVRPAPVPGVPNSGTLDSVGFAHVVEDYNGPGPIDLVQATAAVYQPQVPTPPQTDGLGGHSLAQIWVSTGSAFNTYGNLNCVDPSADCIQSVELGWNVDPVIYRYNNPGSVHLFIFSTYDGYYNGCYNDASLGKRCVTWVGASGGAFTPGQTLTYSSPGTNVSELTFMAENAGNATGWALWVSGNYLGSYAASDFNGSMQNTADSFQLGGEVSEKWSGSTDPGSAWVTPMGTGGDPGAGYKQAAYFRNYQAYNGSSWNSSFTLRALQGDTTVANQLAYSFSIGAPAGGNWSNYFYYGNVAGSFWHQNYRYDWAPIQPDWDSGSYKADCRVGQPMTGLSKYVGGPAHGIRCGGPNFTSTGVGPTDPSGCTFHAFDPGTYQGDTDNGVDWDYGYYKDECKQNEYVSGVAQSTTGALDGIICCPGSVGHNTCTAQVFYSSNSVNYQAPDWDYGRYKGACPVNQYVAGISAVASTQNGIVGDPHAILCCNP
jgi:hypothetical protein